MGRVDHRDGRGPRRGGSLKPPPEQEWLPDDGSSLWDIFVVIFYAPVISGSLLWLFTHGGEWLLWARTIGEEPLRDVSLGLAGGSVLLLASIASERTTVGARAKEALSMILGHRSLGAIAVIAVISSLGEELLFRAVIQPLLGLGVASLLFALVHVPVHRDLWIWPVFALASGLLLGQLFHLTGAALAPFVAHAFFNSVQMLRLRR